MHTYSIDKTDKDLRTRTAVIIFALSMVISLIINEFYADKITDFVNVLRNSRLVKVVELIEWFDVNPNLLGIPFWYGVVTIVYREILWKCCLFRVVHKVPNLNGKWEGTLTSSYGECIPMEMEIKQTWNKISFISQFPKRDSMSCSNVAAIHVNGNCGTEVYFGFRNNGYCVDDRLPSYDGYNILCLRDKNHIKAIYFNNRDNPNPECKGGNKGSFELKRVKKTKKRK